MQNVNLVLNVCFVCLMGTCVLLTSACSDDEQAECITRENCPVDQVCISKSCVQPAGDGTCTDDDQCLRGQICTSGQCTPIGSNPDAGNNGSQPDTSNNNQNPVDMGTPDVAPDSPIDTEAPEVVRVIPAAGATGIAADVDIIITFSEEVREFGLANKIVLANVDTNETVRTVATIDGPTVTLNPSVDLEEGSPYQVIITTEVSDLQGNTLRDEYRWYFSTAIQEEPGHRELAFKYAPVIYQEADPVENIAKSDVFTNLNFDGDFNADNNAAEYFGANLKTHAYYAVTETPTHYFIQYLFYYPTNYNSNSTEYHAHDVTATQVVVVKGGNERFLMAETGYGPQATLYWGFAVEGENIDDRNQGQLEHTFSRESMWRESHYRQYNGDNFHGGCHWTWEPPFNVLAQAPWCNHVAGQFNNPEGSVVYYPGETAQGPRDLACSPDNANDCNSDLGITCDVDTCRDTDGLRAATYTLEDFRSVLWVRRVTLSGEDRLFSSGRREYRPHESGANRPGSGVRVPVSFFSEDEDARGTVPFAWGSDGSVAEGQWWMDPAYTFKERYRLGDSNDGVAENYCFHPWLNIDERGSEGCN